MKFQERIQLIRKENGYSQEELAEKLGISRQAVAKWEAGLSYPDVENLITLSNLYKISIDSMLKSDDDSCSKHQPKVVKALSRDAISFLIKAKTNTYAANAPGVAPSRSNSHDLAYEEGNYKYYDTYLGGEKFIGEEAIWYQDTPLWSMNYVGRNLSDEFQGSFLKEALSIIPEDKPFRGPELYRNGDFTYHCMVNGDVEWFQGYETIFLLDRLVYECYFHGGIVK